MEEEKLNAEEVVKNISKEKMTPFNKLGLSYIAARQLVDFMQVLEKNEKDYSDEINIKTCKDTKIPPSDVLSHYILLEASNFYETLKHLKSTNHSLPNPPPYHDKIVKIRNKLIGHKDTKTEFSLAEDVIKLLKELTKEASTDKIVGDMAKIFNSVKNLLPNPAHNTN